MRLLDRTTVAAPALQAPAVGMTYPAVPPLHDLLVHDQLQAAAELGVALVQLPDDHPVVIAVRVALDLRAAYRTQVETSHAVSAATDWRRVANNHIPHAELQRRRAQPGPLAAERRTA